MNKRIVVVICIIIAALSFMGGMIYTYDDYIPIVEFDFGKSKFTYDFEMPIDFEAASFWLDWAYSYHQYYIDNGIFTELDPLELHQGYVDLYTEIKVLFQEFDEEYK